jgi:hypothetical protein
VQFDEVIVLRDVFVQSFVNVVSDNPRLDIQAMQHVANHMPHCLTVIAVV